MQVQVSRLGMPLVNEVVVPVSVKDYFNASKPKDDIQFLPAVQDPELPHDLNALYGVPVPDSTRSTAGIQRSRPDLGVPHRAPGSEQARRRDGFGAAPPEHGHPALR